MPGFADTAAADRLASELYTSATVPEPMTAILAALAGVVFGSASNWFANVRKRDDSATIALIELAASVKHIDKTLQRFESAFDGVYTTLQRHDNRITYLEAGNGGTPNSDPIGVVR
jgi:hypothetical protein